MKNYEPAYLYDERPTYVIAQIPTYFEDCGDVVTLTGTVGGEFAINNIFVTGTKK